MKRIWLFFNIFWTIIYLIWRTCWTIPIGYGVVALVSGIALLVVEILGMLEAFIHYFNMHKIEDYPKPEVKPEDYPDVDVFIATYNEPVELLYKTINGCVHMDYPDKRKVHIYICDDGNRVEVRELAKQFNVYYLNRDDHKGAKAGNLNHALSVTSSPYIATFDADMIPKHDFLMETVAYFVAQGDQKIGFVQTPQNFYNPDLFQFNLFSQNRIPNEQDYFYKDIQVTRNKSNSVIYGGSNTVIARCALEDVGGFFTKSITEDFATGILIQKKGYRCIAINRVLASGLSATDLKSLINQRIRWGRGCISTGRKVHIICSRHLSFSQKANYLASIWYWYAPIKRLIYILSPILFAVFNVMVVKCTLGQVLFFWLPMYISSNISLKMMSKNIRNTKWTNIYETVLFPYLLVPILLETFGISMKKFKVTTKGQELKNGTSEKLWYALPHSILILLSVIGIWHCLQWTFSTGRIDYFVILFWLLLNLFSLIMSVFFVMGRKWVRKTERMEAVIDCKIEDHKETIEGKTADISEGGLSIILEQPKDINDEEKVEITLQTSRYQATVLAQSALVIQVKEGWKYAFEIVDMLESKDEFLQLVYDREPTLPKNLDESLSTFDDLRLNIIKRLEKNHYQNRKMPRVFVDQMVDSNQKTEIQMINYNYKYILIKAYGPIDSNLKLFLNPKLVIRCAICKNLGDNTYLLTVTNYKEIHENANMRIELEQWLANGMLDESKMVENKKKRQRVREDEYIELDQL
ncbi:cellulose synthase catalytic subunit [UDP-forming] [Lachnospiraceae bacterium KM106-2]|nr:cellulose synthase catalytic subunit [UDP-forming] [Lachnospiraceae bacterium KM106-2]